jgi:AcrR family transcriptional regulator
VTSVERSAPRATVADGGSTFRRILDAASAELAVQGEAGLSLRSVARAVGVSVQSLYHYVDSRAVLVDVLAREAAEALAEAVCGTGGGAVSGSGGGARAGAGDRTADELLAAAGAFLRWAGEHPAAFALLHGRGLPVGPCGCSGTAARLRGVLLGGTDALVPFWAVVYAVAASGGDPCGGAWEPVVADAAARAARPSG